MTTSAAFTPEYESVPWTPHELVTLPSLLPSAEFDGPGTLEAAGHDGSRLLDDYFAVRQQVGLLENRPEGEQLRAIQQQVGTWLETEGPLKGGLAFDTEAYAVPDMALARAKIMGLVEYLRDGVGDSATEIELEATERFLTATEILHAEVPPDGSAHPAADGSFAFVVPARMSRKNTEYGQEVETVLPAFRYVPRHLRAAMMVGLPPFVIDHYKRDEDGKRGYLIFAPVYPDMRDDLGMAGMFRTGRKVVNDAVDFAYGRFGTETVGIGSILPGITNYGNTIDNQNVIITTGHAGTIYLELEVIKRALAEGRIRPELTQKLGILGLGAIGGPAAHVLRHDYPDAEITVYDTREKHTHTIAEAIGGYPAKSEREVIERSGVIVSMLPDIRLSLAGLGVRREDFAGKLLVDDSQPAAFDPEEVRRFGGTLSWVVGQDGDSFLRTDYTYGDTLAAPNDLFGCEAEAAALATYYRELLHDGMAHEEAQVRVREVAVRSAVTPEKVKAIGNLFVRYGVSAAPLQAFGKLV